MVAKQTQIQQELLTRLAAALPEFDEFTGVSVFPNDVGEKNTCWVELGTEARVYNPQVEKVLDVMVNLYVAKRGLGDRTAFVAECIERIEEVVLEMGRASLPFLFDFVVLTSEHDNGAIPNYGAAVIECEAQYMKKGI